MINVIIADNHVIVRAGLADVISEVDDIEVCGTASDIDELLDLVQSVDWDVIVLDPEIDDGNGIKIIDRLKEITPDPKVVVFSIYDETTYAVNVIKAGAKAFLNKNRSHLELLDAIRKVGGGKSYITNAQADYFLKTGGEKSPKRVLSLSQREFEVFILLARGITPTQIAERLDLNVSTIATYTHRVKRKLGVNSLGGIIRLAYRNNLVD